MTEQTRIDLRRGIESVVRAASLSNHVQFLNTNPWGPSLHIYGSGYRPMPELTTAQQLALSVLVGEPDTAVSSALADFLLENGHESAVYEKGKADGVTEERKRVAAEQYQLIEQRKEIARLCDVRNWYRSHSDHQ